jgi:CRP-like cAMP-binding protein
MLTMPKTRLADFKKSKKSSLSTMDLFKKIPSGALREIEINMIEKRYAKRESIFLEEERAESIWFVKEGHVKEVHHSADGRDSTLCMVGPDGMFGISAFTGGEYGFHSVAETDATVVSFPIRVFQALMGKYPEMARAVVAQISQLLRKSKGLQTFSRESVEKRLLHVLVEMVGEFGKTVPLTRREIAEMAGTTVETCIRAFSRFEEEGMIASEHGKFVVRNVEELRARLEEL